MAKQYFRAPRTLAVFAVFASIGLAVACGDDNGDSDSSDDVTPPTGGAGGDSSTGGASATGGNGIGGEGGTPSNPDCYTTEGGDRCFQPSADCTPANNKDFANVCQNGGSCVYKFDNSTLAKLVDGKLPPLQ